MKIISQAATYLDQTGLTQSQIIEWAARTCYKSEDKITPDSAAKIVRRLVKSGHHAAIEFGHVYMKITDNDFMVFFHSTKPHFIHMVGNYVVGNFRAFYDWYTRWLEGKFLVPDMHFDAFMDLIWCLSLKYPEVYDDLYQKLHEKYEPDYDDSDADNPDEVTSPFQFLTREDFIKDFKFNPLWPEASLTHLIPHVVMFTTNRGITHELVRHRDGESYMMESTRYCKYDIEKFGGELTIIEPMQEIRDNPEAYAKWLADTTADEESYMWFVKHGISAQAARGRLPHDIKADIWNCCFEEQWQHKMNLRYHEITGPAHPQFKELMELVRPDLIKFSEGRIK